MNAKSGKIALLKFFRENGNVLTLGQILTSGRFAAGYRARMTELRKDGAEFILEKDTKEPTKNRYILVKQPVDYAGIEESIKSCADRISETRQELLKQGDLLTDIDLVRRP